MEINHLRHQEECFLCHMGDIWQDALSLDHLMQ